MSVYKCPVKCIQEVTRLIHRFWWNKEDNKKGVSWINKEVLQRGKLEGGLGFRDLKCFNDAFLMKICWRIAKYPHLLMSKLLVSKYCPDGDLNVARLGSRPSHVWRGVMKVLDLFRAATWWDSNRASIRWKYSSNGQFSVKSAYALIMDVQRRRREDAGEQSDNSRLMKFWKRIWWCKVPNKVKIFCWRLYHDSLPDAKNLCRMGLRLDHQCKICGDDMESVLHVVKDCWWARELMIRLGVALPELDGQSTDHADWLWACVWLLNMEELRDFLVALWLCWKNRNRVWHDQGCWGVDRAAILGKNMIRHMEVHFWPNPRVSIDLVDNGRHPGSDGLVIYVDGSWDVKARKAGIGVAMCDQEGIIQSVLALWRNDCGCISEVEGIALLQGFKLAERLKIRKVCFKLDSLEVYRAISLGSGTGDWCEYWLEAGVDFLRRNAGWTVSLVERECNLLADFLASKARREEWSWSSLDIIPFCLKECF